ncbi:proteasome activator complex subunit 3 [Cimex lectularius]|uniref:Proteasome activator complex subunit 3 n=1 Tax=Cimex lectularius TaxID=79782 RepID=A0A8I6RZF0_CIMLE|nr:proteasome activator complex subunit 3 [Cimex lectularius]
MRKMANAAAEKVQQFKDSLILKAEQLILKGFPEKIVLLNEILESPQLNEKNLSKVYQAVNIPIPEPITFNNCNDNDSEPAPKKLKTDALANCVEGTKVMALESGPVPCNQVLLHVIRTVKPHIKQLVEDANLLKMWISFMIPKIEDGNNFGVSVQEETLAEIQSVESEAAAFFDQISRYFCSRAKVISKVAKYPHVEDYRQAVKELDEKEYLSMWLIMCEVRNRYSTLHDIVIKNLEKIKKPRSTNSESLY